MFSVTLAAQWILYPISNQGLLLISMRDFLVQGMCVGVFSLYTCYTSAVQASYTTFRGFLFKTITKD